MDSKVWRMMFRLEAYCIKESMEKRRGGTQDNDMNDKFLDFSKIEGAKECLVSGEGSRSSFLPYDDLVDTMEEWRRVWHNSLLGKASAEKDDEEEED